MKLFNQITVITLLLAFLTACTPNISPDQYATTETGQASATQLGVVMHVRPVVVSGDPSGSNWGALAGGLAGAAGGSALGGGARMNIIGGVAGAVGGALLGNAIQNSLTTQSAMEYIVKTTNNDIVTVTQAPTTPFSVGERVYIIYGDKTRIIPADS